MTRATELITLLMIAGTLLTSGPVLAAGKKKPVAALTLSIAMDSGCSDGSCSDWSGTFDLSGPVSDSGTASAPLDPYAPEDMSIIVLDGAAGVLSVTFTETRVVRVRSGKSRTVLDLEADVVIQGEAGAHAGLMHTAVAVGTLVERTQYDSPWDPRRTILRQVDWFVEVK